MNLISGAIHEENFSFVQLPDFCSVAESEFTHERLPGPFKGKRFLSQELKCSGLVLSCNSLPPHQKMPFLHRHVLNEEVYVFLKGTGEFVVDGKCFNVTEGSMVRVRTSGIRGWRNLSDEPLIYLVIQSREGQFTADQSIEDGMPVSAF